MSRVSKLQPRNSYLLEIIIPTYKRPSDAVVAALSVLEQIILFGLSKEVHVVICDDCTPRLDNCFFAEQLEKYTSYMTILRNSSNKGMSANIFDLVASSTSTFCTILTDDDWVEPTAIAEIVNELESCHTEEDARCDLSTGAIFVPRYSYLDSGDLWCIACSPYAEDVTIHPTPENVIKYSCNAFILTGLIFRPGFVDPEIWRENLDNAFFPLLYYATIASKSQVKYLNRKWFHHTCLNLCHWEAWGATELQRSIRLHQDYLRALLILRKTYPPASGNFLKRQYYKNYRDAIVRLLASYKGPRWNQFLIVYSLANRSPRLIKAYLSFMVRKLFEQGKHKAKAAVAIFVPSKS